MRLTHTFLSVLRSVHLLVNHEEVAKSTLLEFLLNLIFVFDDFGVVVLLRYNDNRHLKGDDF